MVWRPEPSGQGRQPAVVVQQDPPQPATGSVPKSGVNPERWSEILDAAGQIFNEKGYQAARIEDIAGRVGILRGSLYYYIDSKEDLLYALSVAGHTSGLSTIDEDEATTLRRRADPARRPSSTAGWRSCRTIRSTPPSPSATCASSARSGAPS